MMVWWKRFARRAVTLLLTVLMLLGAAAGEGTDKTVINRINAPDVSADFAFAEDAELLEKHGIHEAKVRSVLTCHARNGVCSKCYGLNLALQ